MQLLKDKDIFPSLEIIEKEISNVFSLYKELLLFLEEENIELSWRYYNDWKAWLLKSVYKSKTIFWLSLWEWYFKLSFHFTEKNEWGINDLDINDKIKEKYFNTPIAWKLRTFIVDIKEKNNLEDAKKLIVYKKSLK